HCQSGAAGRVRSHIPGALSILKGAVPGRARGSGHMAPTYFRREPGIATPTAIAAPHCFYCVRLFHPACPMTASAPRDMKQTLRREMIAQRDALTARERVRAAMA